jgi:hypothetical protein
MDKQYVCTAFFIHQMYVGMKLLVNAGRELS